MIEKYKDKTKRIWENIIKLQIKIFMKLKTEEIKRDFF